MFLILVFSFFAGAAEKCLVMDRITGGIIDEFDGKCVRARAPEKYKDRVNFELSQDKNLEQKEAIKARLKAAAPNQNQVIKDIIELLVGEPAPFEKLDDLLPIPPKKDPFIEPPVEEEPKVKGKGK